MLHDLVTPEDGRAIQIEPSGCLDKCGNGPNVCIKSSGGNEQMFGHVEDLSTASAIMEVGAEIDCPIPLMVAVQGMAKAALGKSRLSSSLEYTQISTCMPFSLQVDSCFALPHQFKMQ